MIVELAAGVQGQIDRIDDWWREHRPGAPDLFRDEFGAALRRRESDAATIPISAATTVAGVRRVRLPRSGYFVYFRIVDERVRVTAVWHEARRAEPADDDLARERAVGYGRQAA